MNRSALLIALISIVYAHSVAAQESHNLLARPDIVFLQQQSAGINLGDALLITDENLTTASVIEVSKQNPVELVYSLSDSIVTPTALRLQVESLTKDSASIEVLVSEQGPDTGYLSLS